MCSVFPGDIRDEAAFDRLRTLGHDLSSPHGPAKRYTPKDEDIDSILETLTVFSTPHAEVQLRAHLLPSILVPERKPYGVKGK